MAVQTICLERFQDLTLDILLIIVEARLLPGSQDIELEWHISLVTEAQVHMTPMILCSRQSCDRIDNEASINRRKKKLR